MIAGNGASKVGAVDVDGIALGAACNQLACIRQPNKVLLVQVSGKGAHAFAAHRNAWDGRGDAPRLDGAVGRPIISAGLQTACLTPRRARRAR